MTTTVKHLSYSGVTIPLLPPSYTDGWLRAVHDPYDFLDLTPWNFDQPAAPALPSPSIPTPPQFEFNKLHWPTGASRPAWFHCVVTADRLASIKSAVGSYSAPADLVFFDGRVGKTITARMRMLPERPLNVTLGNSASQAWILTLTDERFFWYYRRGEVTTPSSWANLYSQLATLLGVSISVETVDPAYGTPSAKWVRNYSNSNVLLDGVAAQVGQRVVVGLDGSVRVVNWESAKAASDAYYAAGPTVVSGGLTSESDTARTVPSKVRTVFGRSNSGVLDTTPYVVENTLASLAVAGYGAATGVPDTYETVFADLAYTGSNAAACAAYAVAAAIDYYGWLLNNPDIAYPGTEPWTPTGWEDRVEWTMRLVGNDEPFAETTVRRGSFLGFTGGDYSAGLAPPIPCEWIPGGCGSGGGGSGSGSGSGSGGCGVTVTPVEFTCSNGVRTATVNEIAVGVVDGQLVAEVCGSEVVDLGACSPLNPDGTTLPIVVKVCPVFTTLNYLDHDSLPQTMDVVTGITVERRLVTVPVAGPVGCVIDMTDCCSGSGSGSGSGGGQCTQDCDQCTEMSAVWELSGVSDSTVQLFHDDTPDDGNYCSFTSLDLTWRLYYDYGDEVWLLVNYDTEQVWFITKEDWGCLISNTLTAINPDDPDAQVDPLYDCTTTSWNCVDGACVEIAGSGGMYPTQVACQAACGGGTVIVSCCPDPIPRVLYLHFSDGSGGMECLDGSSHQIVYDDVSGTWIGSGAALTGCGGNPFTVMQVYCTFATFSLLLAGCVSSLQGLAITTCSPFVATANLSTIGDCVTGGTGNTTITVNATP